MRLANRSALVTGAGSGIGAAIARALADEGAQVCVTGRDPDRVAGVVSSIENDGGSAFGASVDVRDSKQIAAAIEMVVDRTGSLDIVVANAARAGTDAYIGPLLSVSDEEWNDIIATNLSGVFFTAREAARVMVPQESGSIITIGSVNSFVPEANVPAYAASKGGVLLLTRSLAENLGPYGVRVNGIAPGATDSENILRAIGQMGPSAEEKLNERIPLGYRAQPEAIGSIAVFLASDESAYIHGEMIVADGGFLCT